MKRKPTPTEPGNFVDPTGPDMAALMRIHPDGEGRVLFANGERLRPFAALTPGELASLLPGILPELEVDSYYTPSRFKTPKGKLYPGYAKAANVSHLTSAWVDIDCHAIPGGALEMWQVMGDVLRAVERGAIPSPSVYGSSGRGLWLLWSIHPVELATPIARNLLVRINRAAAEMFARLGADPSAVNVSRWTRVPGSVNSKAGKRCAYLFAADEQGAPIYYTLAELAEAFKVTECPVPEVFTAIRPERRLHLERVEPGQQSRVKNPAKVAAGYKGQIARNVNTAAALTHLATLRGGYRKHTQNLACFYLAVYLHRAGRNQAAIYSLLSSREMFSPPLSKERVVHHMNAGREFKNLRTADGSKPIGQQTIADALQITPDEARAIEECTGKPFPHAYQNQLVLDPPNQSRRERQQARRERAKEIVANIPGGMAERALLRKLQEEGYDVSPERIHADLVALGLNRPRRKPSRHEPPPELDL